MSRRSRLILRPLGALAIAVAGYFAMLIATDPSDNLRLVASGSRIGPSGDPLVTAAIRNFTDDTYARVEVELELLGESGHVVASSVLATSDLRAGETWTLEAPVSAGDVVSVRLANLVCSKDGGPPHPRACFIPPTVVALAGN